MSLDEFFALPEAPPVIVEGGMPLFARAGLKNEGEHYVHPWQSPDGKPWWSIENGARRQTFAHKDEV